MGDKATGCLHYALRTTHNEWMDGWASERKVTGRGFSSGGACLYAVHLQETTRIAKGRATRGLNGNSDEAATEDDEADATHQKCCRKVLYLRVPATNATRCK